jgi:hypothetical protein
MAYSEENYKYHSSVGADGIFQLIHQQNYRLDDQGIGVHFTSRVGVFLVSIASRLGFEVYPSS